MSEAMIIERAGQRPRTKKRSRSGANERCAACGKLLRGAKGLKLHMAQMHGARP